MFKKKKKSFQNVSTNAAKKKKSRLSKAQRVGHIRSEQTGAPQNSLLHGLVQPWLRERHSDGKEDSDRPCSRA